MDYFAGIIASMCASSKDTSKKISMNVLHPSVKDLPPSLVDKIGCEISVVHEGVQSENIYFIDIGTSIKCEITTGGTNNVYRTNIMTTNNDDLCNMTEIFKVLQRVIKIIQQSPTLVQSQAKSVDELVDACGN